MEFLEGKTMTFKCLKGCGKCCGPVPIPKDVYERNRHKVRALTDDILETNGEVFVTQEDGFCIFLSEEKECLIYDERPEVCRLYGISNDPRLMCMFLKPNGKPRSKASIKQLDRLLRKTAGRIISGFEGD